MSKYRFKTKEEFIRDGLWDDKHNCPDKWAFEGQMNKYLGADVPDIYNDDCDEKEDFRYNGWLFQNTDYVLKEQQEYFDDLSQHIGRYIRALVDNPHSGSRVKKGDVGKIINEDQADFPNNKEYFCTEALRKENLGIKYELLPEDYSPEQETKEPNIEFIPGKWYKYNRWYIKYKEHIDNVWRSSEQIDSCKKYRQQESKFGDRDSDDKKILLLDLSEIQEYLPEGHPDKIKNFKLEVGKWYSFNWDYSGKDRIVIAKIKKVEEGYFNISWRSYLWIDKSYSNSDAYCFKDISNIKELSIKEIQKYLPDEHPDKIGSFNFEVGKWYNFTTMKGKYNLYVKVNRVTDKNLFFMNGESISNGYFGKATCIELKLIENPRLVEDLSEIQNFLPDEHPDKIINQKFEIGKWYKWYQKNYGNYHYGKVEKINLETDTLVMFPWIMQCTDYMYSGSFDLSKAEQIQEISVKEVQEFLPEGHVDKFCETCNGEGETMVGKLYPSGHIEVTDTCPDCNGTGFTNNVNKITSNEFKKGEYIVLIDYSPSFSTNYIYKQRENYYYLRAKLDNDGDRNNGNIKFQKKNPYNWRYATQEEIDEYERRGKPYDVTELQKKELSMEKIQEECKKRFPIGCTYISTNKQSEVLKDDSYTYSIIGKQIWAHSGGGCLYENGEWAELVSLPEENITEIPEYVECVDYFSTKYKGKIYNTKIDKPEEESICSWYDILIESGRLEDGSFKISNKEAYEKQKLKSSYVVVHDPFQGTTSSNTNFILDEIGQYPLTPSDCWKNIPKFVEKEFDIYGPTPDIE